DDRGEGSDLTEVVRALAADGVRAIAPDLSWTQHDGGHDGVGADHSIELLLGVLRNLELPSAVFVGCGAAVEVVTRLASDHPDRVEAIVLACESAEQAASVSVSDALPVPVLVLDDARRVGDPEAFADDIVEFLRHL